MARSTKATTTPVITGRRSNRLASVTGDDIGDASSAVPLSATPSRRLPAVSARSSRAYGASGRATGTELIDTSADNTGTGFNNAFGGQVGSAYSRTARRQYTTTRQERDNSSMAPPSSHLQSATGNDSSSMIDTSKSFGMVHEAGMTHDQETTAPVRSTVPVRPTVPLRSTVPVRVPAVAAAEPTPGFFQRLSAFITDIFSDLHFSKKDLLKVLIMLLVIAPLLLQLSSPVIKDSISVAVNHAGVVKDLSAIRQGQIEHNKLVTKEIADIRQAQTKLHQHVTEEVKRQVDAALQASELDVNLRRVNYFSPSLGAHVIPWLTSPSYRPQQWTLFRGLRLFEAAAEHRPAMTALQRWEEPGDCWCAARDDTGVNGMAQLAVALPAAVYPTAVTIEHPPMAMMPRQDVRTAPRAFELWIKTDSPPVVVSSSAEPCDPAPSQGWTCLGRFSYNILGGVPHRQTFDVQARSSEPVRQALVRVASNWGADFTCLYRVQLHGLDGGPAVMYPE
ncbi:hypothetical protein BS50DRAFT_139079 [Corynespora cassiicola Philippines]|uniref:SUN domain-containing protein n=1 Tax=Corynespora cassiicola Philippines TaxID=1448308 RepID=A0A2T2N9R9_CORCC|nr:hypothetical protein BS50DRAFT_139079 [Corynespora cassiicola Philippines]